ncbi:MAG: peptidoglycan-binding domain-containing protein, partial [Methanocella sp.]
MPDWSGTPLRRGHRGEAVAELQRRLSALGYAPGPVDGRFGQLTEEAVIQLQADYRLKQDGIAGRQVAGLLRAGLPATGRLLHTVGPGEDVYTLAERFGVSPKLLGHAGRAAGGTPPPGGEGLPAGARLVIPVRPVLAALDEAGERTVEGLRRVLARHRAQITALAVPWASWT